MYKDLLLSFINAVRLDLLLNAIVTILIKNPFHIKQFERDKETIVDIKAIDDRGRQYDMEAQSTNRSCYIDRSLFYWAQMHGSQLQSGEDYTELHPTVGIHLLEFTLFEDHDNFHTLCTIRHNRNPNKIVTDKFALHYLELSKVKPVNFSDKLINWLLFFKYEGLEENPMAKTIEKLIRQDEDIARAHEAYERFTKDKALRELYESHLKWKRDYKTDIVIAEQKGVEKGEIREKQHVLTLQMSQKFSITESDKAWIASIQDKDKLDKAIAHILTASSKDELFALLK